MIGALLPAAMIGASALGSLLNKGKSQTVTQQDLRTPEQFQALKDLLSYGEGDTTGYDGSLGNYTMSPAEQAGQTNLMKYITGANPDIFNTGVKSLSDLLSTNKFDPYSDTGEYNGFAQATDLATKQGTDALKRSAAFGGNLFSKDTVNRAGNLQQQGQQQKSNKLAELYRQYVQDKIGAIPQALAAGTTQQNMDLSRISASQQFGALPRILQDQELKDKFNAFNQNQSAKVGALQTVATANPNLGIPSYTQPATGGPWSSVLNLIAQSGGAMLGAGMFNSSSNPSGFMNNSSALNINPWTGR